MLGLERGVVRLAPYCDAWPALFVEEAARVTAALGDRIGRLEHMGSTAIPGAQAKPIIDMMAAVDDLDEAMALIPEVEALGYELRPDVDIPERHRFILRPDGNIATHHFSLAEPTCEFWHRQLLFRDYLRAHTDVRDAYVALKQTLAVEFRNDRPAYVDAKTEFVQSVLRRAAAEA